MARLYPAPFIIFYYAIGLLSKELLVKIFSLCPDQKHNWGCPKKDLYCCDAQKVSSEILSDIIEFERDNNVRI
jgi:hypothetical protein